MATKLEARVDEHDRKIAAIQELILAGVKLINSNAAQIRSNAAQIRALAVSQERMRSLSIRSVSRC
jgi:hypothetical protein